MLHAKKFGSCYHLVIPAVIKNSCAFILATFGNIFNRHCNAADISVFKAELILQPGMSFVKNPSMSYNLL